MLPLKQFSVWYRALPVVLCFVCESHFTPPFLKMHSWSVLWLGEVSLGTFGTPHMEKENCKKCHVLFQRWLLSKHQCGACLSNQW